MKILSGISLEKFQNWGFQSATEHNFYLPYTNFSRSKCLIHTVTEGCVYPFVLFLKTEMTAAKQFFRRIHHLTSHTQFLIIFHCFDDLSKKNIKKCLFWG